LHFTSAKIALGPIRHFGGQDGNETIRTFADSRTHDLGKVIPRIVTTIAAIAAAKKLNREFETRRRATQEDAARRWAEAEAVTAC
jgi:hypothetical protein